MKELAHYFFELNRPVIFFIYGQIFFILGFALAMQSWRHSRLMLARSLKWLAAFGFIHGLHEWGDIFIPIQAGFLAAPFVEILLVVQVILLAVSFTCLFQFGIETLRPLLDRQKALLYFPGAILTLWIFLAFGPTVSLTNSTAEWVTINNISARYLIGFLGALVAAYGLRRQAYGLVAPLELPYTIRMLRVAGFALAGYAVLGGLVVPPADFFPANWLNQQVIENVTLIPVQMYRSALGLILAVAIIRALGVFRVELDRQLISMEENQMLIAERERIGRELHDGTLQTIYATGLLLKTSEEDLAQQDCPAESLERMQQSIALLDEAVAHIRGYIGTLRPQSAGHSLVSGLRELASARQFRSLVEIELDLALPEEHVLPSTFVGHLLAITNEALSNIARHARAKHVCLTANIVDGRLRLKIEDDGRGMPADYTAGYGLRNMRDRARMLGGELALQTEPAHGTTVIVEVPWETYHDTLTTPDR